MRLSRRRAIGITAAAGGLALLSKRRDDIFVWTGTALGADARIAIAGLDRPLAERAAMLARDEISRLEKAFSLYLPESEISRLNRDGVLHRPSQDFRILLGKSLLATRCSDGAFNPAIQPLWTYLARTLSASPGIAPNEEDVKRQLRRCDPSRIDIASSSIRLQTGMALTFNGIAQGYITDRAASVLEGEGLSDILIDLGETYALPGRAWDVAVAGESRRVPLCHRAIAQSSGRGTLFTGDGRWHHIIDPFSGMSANRFAAVTVEAATATDADWLSTALYILDPERHSRVLARVPGAVATKNPA